MTFRRRLLPLIALIMALPLSALAHGLKYVETADGQKTPRTRQLIEWTHTRLVFSKELERVAVGQDAILELEVLGPTEILALAKKLGRTSIMIWYTDKTTETFLFSVVQDLTVLRRALRDVHPGIGIERAPDRAALILRGRVPTVTFRSAAEAVARNYLEAGNRRAPAATDILLQSGGDRAAQEPELRVTDTDGDGKPSAAVINLIQVDELPASREEKILQAIRLVGGEQVQIRRIQQGDLANDGRDTLVLSGTVANQVILTRVLNIATRMYLGTDPDGAGVSMHALTDESGALLVGRDSTAALSNLGGTGSLSNEIHANVARSKLISAASGHILSVIDVRDLPQVRVAVQMHEIERSRLKSWRPDLTAITRDYNSTGRFGVSGLQQQPPTASRLENALQVIGGALSNNLQVASSRFTFDLLFSLLEEAGISRTLARPTLTVLAGESAVFRAGGEVPVPTAFAPTGIANDDKVGNNTAGVFSGTEFKAFGVELRVRAMVDEHDRITLDINPTVSLPDTSLTQQIKDSTGSSLNASAFDVRSINTSARLLDGQPLVIGGLVSRDISSSDAHTPGLSAIPLAGKLAQSELKRDTERELIIVVTPTIVRSPRHDVNLWIYPDAYDLLTQGLTRSQRSTETSR